MRIEQLMSQPVKTCGQYDTLNVAAQVMWESDCGAVPVVDSKGTAIGMITDRDICMAAYTQGAPLWEIPVGSAMSRDVRACDPTDSVEAVEQQMREHRLHRLPVIDDHGRVLGIVSFTDIAREVARTKKKNGAHARLIETLTAIRAPRQRHAIEAERQDALVVEARA